MLRSTARCFLSAPLIPIRKALGAVLPAERNPSQHINRTATLAHEQPTHAKKRRARGSCPRILPLLADSVRRAPKGRGEG